MSKGATRKANGSPSLIVTNQKSNSTLVGAVAFLMFIFSNRLTDTYNRHDNTNDCYNDTYYSD